jgi:hypothetical protein
MSHFIQKTVKLSCIQYAGYKAKSTFWIFYNTDYQGDVYCLTPAFLTTGKKIKIFQSGY